MNDNLSAGLVMLGLGSALILAWWTGKLGALISMASERTRAPSSSSSSSVDPSAPASSGWWQPTPPRQPRQPIQPGASA